MDLEIRDKRALVTGASKGIGRAVAIGLAQEGAKVAACARSHDDLLSLMMEMGSSQAGHWMFCLDLMEDGAPTSLALKSLETMKQVDIIVHCVGGTLGYRDPFCTTEQWRLVWRLNFEIALEINQQLLPQMLDRKWGRVVHMSSIAAVRGRASLPYTVAKAAVNSYVAGLGRLVASEDVVVTALMPGAIRTAGGHWDSVCSTDPQYARRYLDERIACKRFGAAEEIRDMALFLCSPRASFSAGAVIPIDGGTW